MGEGVVLTDTVCMVERGVRAIGWVVLILGVLVRAVVALVEIGVG